ncbi:MBG domain-containing protein [Chitinophaga sp. Cy-1792]|uniref:MBG domain-containing protein n=1 Tax=Chitinophaga sp. Cy-1792 TaxID=2608339 RepID=UPI00142486AA|nr:MBG domain-containing protein [Chitinophaga sp. Cy-1792]NIG55668.1 hypothetical protein [Chitinophaga sp. Cy-1792]
MNSVISLLSVRTIYHLSGHLKSRFTTFPLLSIFCWWILSTTNLYAQTPDANGVLYVKKGGAGNASGNSWGNAIAELDTALTHAKRLNNSSAGTVKQIWVAAGTYYPSQQVDGGTANSRRITFSLLPDVQIYGHFGGTETSLTGRSSDASSNITTLSGDIGTPGTKTDNAFHVVTGYGNLGSALIDGLTITDGYANDYSDQTQANNFTIYAQYGGGLYLTNQAGIPVTNVTFINNYASGYGGAVFMYINSNPTFTNVTFSNNSANAGGALCAFNGSACSYSNTSFTGNSASIYGGAIYSVSNSTQTFNNVSITGNTSAGYGGAIYVAAGSNIIANYLAVRGNTATAGGGAIYQSQSSGFYTNTLFSGNYSNSGGGALFCFTTSFKLVNTTIAGNTATNGSGGAIFNSQSTGVIYNTVIGDNSGGIYNDNGGSYTAQYSFLQGVATDISLHNPDGTVSPGFTNSLATGTAFTGGAYTVQASSPLVNAGSNALFTGLNASTVDLSGAPRVSNFSTGGIIDIGAYEKALTAQTIAVSNISKTYGDADVELTFTASSGLPVSYTSADASIVNVYQDASDNNKWKAHIKKAGNVIIIANQLGNATYDPVTTPFNISIAKASLVITARDSTKYFDGIPFSGGNGVSYAGFVNGDDSTTALTGTLSYSGTAQSATGVGIYNLVPNGLIADNYSITYVAGKLNIQMITLTNGILYVKKGSTGNGSSWANATGELADALRTAAILNGTTNGTVQQIWVAKGTYLPKYPASQATTAPAGNDRSNAFLLVKDVKVFGGFAGTESDTTGRDFTTNTTVLSGNLGDPATNSDNAYHVVIAAGDMGAAVLSGFTIADGYSNYSGNVSINNVNVPLNTGGGLIARSASLLVEDVILSNNYNSFGGAAAFYSSATDPSGTVVLRRVSCLNNTAASGGAFYASYADLTLENVICRNNSTANTAGAFLIGQNATVSARHSSFNDNKTSGIGSAILVNANGVASFYNCEFLRDTTLTNGGAISANTNAQVVCEKAVVKGCVAVQYGAAATLYAANSAAITFLNSQLTGNSSGSGGTINVNGGSFNLVNSTLSGNNMAGIYCSNGNTAVYNSIIYGNNTGIAGAYTSKYSTIQGASPNAGNYITNTDPLFVNSPAFNTAPFTNGDYSLQPASPAVNAGSDSIYNVYDTATLDLAGNSRKASTIDQGAYELQLPFSQTITSLTDTAVSYGTVFTRALAASSGLPVSLSSADNNIAEVYQDAADGNQWKIRAKKAGTVNITISQAGNAIYAPAADIVFALTVNKVNLVVSANSATKTYDGLAFAGGNGVTYQGFINGDDSTAALTGTLTYSGTAQGAKDVNTYVITPGGLAAVNYTIVYGDGALTINKAGLTITAKDSTMIYNGLSFNGGNGLLYSGLVNNEDSAKALTGTVTYTGNSQGAKNVNSYFIIPGGLSAANYTITYTSGTLTINKAALTVTAKDSTKIYDGVAYSGGNGVTYSGFVNNETVTTLAGILTYSGTSQGAINANSYVITPGGLSAGNYAITYANGNLTISKAALTVTANNAAKVYDGVAYSGGNGVTWFGFVNNETAAALGGTVTYSGTSQGAINANSYVITPGGLSSGNYAITYANGNLTISKAALTVTANNASKVYDGVAYSGGNGVTWSGFVNNETAAALGGTVTYSGTSQGATNVNSYVITPGGLSSGNYNISYANGNLTISKATLTVTANNASKVYDGIAYSGGNGVSWSGFVNNETAAALGGTVTYSGTSQGATNVNSYVITPGGLSSGNYNISYANGSLTISKAILTVIADAKTKVYGTGDPAYTYTVTGYGSGDNQQIFSGSLGRVTGEDAGVYPINQGTLNAGNNYTVSFTGNNLTITKAPQTISWTQDLTMGCNGTPATVTLTAAATSGLPVSYSVADASIATVNGTTLTPVSPGSSVVTATQAGDGNHFAATAVTNTFNNLVASMVRQHWADVLVFDNTGNNYNKWQWYKDGTPINGATNAYYSESTALKGTYYVMATSNNGNIVQSCPLTLTGTGAVSDGIKAYPNPAAKGSTVKVTCNYTNAQLQGARLLITTVTGNTLQQITSVQSTNQVTMPSQSGVYVIILMMSTGQKATVNVIVQ